MIRDLRRFMGWTGPLLLAFGCGKDDHSLPRGQGGASEDDISSVSPTVEIFSWWTSRGEREALQALIEVHKNRVPQAKVTNAAVAFADKAREQLEKRMVEALPPDTFQANAGADLFDWVVVNGEDASDAKVESLQGLAEQEGWLELLHPEVLRAATFDGQLYAVPLNVHRINSLFYRKDLFEKYALEVPANVQQLNELCERIKNEKEIQNGAPGGRMACLGLGNKWRWPLQELAMETLLVAMAGARYYESFWLGGESGEDPQLRAVLEEVLLLYCGGTDTKRCKETSYFNDDLDEITWDAGVRKLVEGSALMAPMGDWAKGLLQAEGLIPGRDFDEVPFPGSAGAFIFTSDTFPLPKGAPNRRGAVELLKTCASSEAQLAFNQLKGSIPSRVDIGPEEFDEVTQRTMRAFREDQKVPALTALLPNALLPDLSEELWASAESGSIEIISNYLQANYVSLGR